MHKLILLTLAIVSGCHGYNYVIPASFRTPGICFYNGRILPRGNSQIPMVCQVINCREDGSIMVNGCGRISLHKCSLIEEGRLLKGYPECCEMTYKCVNADGSTYIKEWNQLDPTNSKIIPAEKHDEIVPVDPSGHIDPPSENHGEVAPENHEEVAPENHEEVAPENNGEVGPENNGEVGPENNGEVAPENHGEVAPPEKNDKKEDYKMISPFILQLLLFI